MIDLLENGMCVTVLRSYPHICIWKESKGRYLVRCWGKEQMKEFLDPEAAVKFFLETKAAFDFANLPKK